MLTSSTTTSASRAFLARNQPSLAFRARRRERSPCARRFCRTSRRMSDSIPCSRAREQRERSRDVCDDVTNAVRLYIRSLERLRSASRAGEPARAREFKSNDVARSIDRCALDRTDESLDGIYRSRLGRTLRRRSVRWARVCARGGDGTGRAHGGGVQARVGCVVRQAAIEDWG